MNNKCIYIYHPSRKIGFTVFDCLCSVVWLISPNPLGFFYSIFQNKALALMLGYDLKCIKILIDRLKKLSHKLVEVRYIFDIKVNAPYKKKCLVKISIKP